MGSYIIHRFKSLIMYIVSYSLPAAQILSSYRYHIHFNHRFCRLSDERSAFCLNGLEIDLDELEALEQRVKAKKRLQEAPDGASTSNTSTSKPPADDNEVDELDEYLRELKLRESRDQSAIEQDQQQLQRHTNNNVSSSYDINESRKLAILLYWFLAILNLANAVYCKHFEWTTSNKTFHICCLFSFAVFDDDDEEGDSDGSDDEDNGDVSLSEVCDTNILSIRKKPY